MPHLAIDHAQAGADVERVNRLMLLNAEKAFATGRGETIRRWLEWFEDENLVEHYPAVAVLGALFYIGMGEAAAAERWADAAEHPSPALLPDGSAGARPRIARADPSRRQHVGELARPPSRPSNVGTVSMRCDVTQSPRSMG